MPAVSVSTVLHVIDTLGRGGAEQALVNLLPAIQARDVEVHVAVLRAPDTLAGELESRGVKVHRFSGFRQWNLVRGASELNRLADELEADVIHSHLYFPGLYNAWGARKGERRARLASFHNLAYAADAHRSGWKSNVRKFINRILLNRGLDASSAVSQAAAEHYEEHLRLQDIRVIPNALPEQPDTRLSEQEMAGLRGELGVTDGEVFLVCPGRLVLEKGHMDLLAACQVLVARGFSFKLFVTGDGPLEKTIREKISELGLGEQVFLKRALPQAELFKYVQAADGFVTSSIHEGFGLVVAEVMALGCPVVATRVGGIPDIVDSEEVGRLVPPSDPQAMADAVMGMFAEPETARVMGAAGARRVLEVFSAERVASVWVDYYMELLSAKCA